MGAGLSALGEPRRGRALLGLLLHACSSGSRRCASSIADFTSGLSMIRHSATGRLRYGHGRGESRESRAPQKFIRHII